MISKEAIINAQCKGIQSILDRYDLNKIANLMPQFLHILRNKEASDENIPIYDVYNIKMKPDSSSIPRPNYNYIDDSKWRQEYTKRQQERIRKKAVGYGILGGLAGNTIQGYRRGKKHNEPLQGAMRGFLGNVLGNYIGHRAGLDINNLISGNKASSRAQTAALIGRVFGTSIATHMLTKKYLVPPTEESNKNLKNNK